MIFEELVTDVCDRLNLTSDEAKSRVGRELNNRYRRVTSSIGLETSRRTTTPIAATCPPNSSQMTFSGIEKIILVFDNTDPAKPIVLKQVTMDEIRQLPIKTSTPRHYAVTNMHPHSVDVYIDTKSADPITLYADGHINLSTLAGSNAPDFPESFHDILIFGAMADEYKRLEKMPLAQDAELNYEKRLSDLRMWIAKAAYLDIVQSKYNRYRTTLGLPFNGSGDFI